MDELSQTQWHHNDRLEYILGGLDRIVSIQPYFGSLQDQVLHNALNKIEKLNELSIINGDSLH